VPEPCLKRSVPACSHFVVWEEDSHSATECSAPPGISPMEILSVAPSMVGSYALILSPGKGGKAIRARWQAPSRAGAWPPRSRATP
jgi:hypothetical protein